MRCSQCQHENLPGRPAAFLQSQPPSADTTPVSSSTAPALRPSLTKASLQSHRPTVPAEPHATEAVQDERAVTPAPVHSTPEAERRQLTVMFCDLADSTQLAQQLDPEDLRAVIRAYQETAATVIHHYAGHIAQYLGDVLLVYFGWPVAHEDDAPRAVHAGLGLVEAITNTLNPRLAQDTGVQLAARLGIHTGPVVVGAMGGDGRQEQLATGDTVNIASRLEGLAAPDTLGMVLFWRGESAAAQIQHTQALAIYTPQTHRALAVRYGVDLGVASLGFLAWELWQLGYPDQALQHSQEARTLAQEVTHPFSLTAALVWSAIMHQHRRAAPAVYGLAEAALTLVTEQGFAQWVARGTVLHGWALAMQGQGEAGIAAILQGLAADLATGAKLFQPYFLGLLAEAYGAGGHPEEALPMLAEALALIDTTEARYYAAALSRLKGVLLLQQTVPDAAQAEACYQQALEVARQQQAKSLELRAATSLARLWQSQDKHQEAVDLLVPVYGWFTEGFDTADLQEAKALLAKLA
jgi:class 3 adenylate cyclase/predicted ATPase